ncbi:ABC transporter permease [Labedaea rhizosphaerae]|uniref:Putative ABC transport system permease protein n=1 Tax=Labedaea rhizosphaerae TaxID=598644 RepID=A0A4R6RZ26_LABRH|nr:ABC transporter permease [Labedaea rhizosphaerae]TDP92213.1 putative ABC transport system permease protein [Labedaea rhizosphaerae]
MQLPWKRAPRAALSGPLTVLVTMVAAVVLSFVAAAAVLHTESAAGAAVAYQESRLCQQSLATGYEMRGAEFTSVKSMLDTAHDEGAKNGFTDTIRAVYAPLGRVDYHGIAPYARFGYRDGAFDNLKVLQGGGRDGLWVPASFAQTAHVKLGDRGLGGQLPPVTAIYQDISDSATPEFWCTERPVVIVPPLSGDGTGPVIFTPSIDTLHHLVSEDTLLTATARYPVRPAPGTLAQARDLLTRSKHASRIVVAQFGNASFTATDAFDRPVVVAEQAQQKVRDSTLPLIAISLLVGLVGLAAVAVQWCQRRHTELRLLWTRGAGLPALGGRAALELAAPLVLGGALGLLLADLLRGWYAPAGALPDGSHRWAALLVAGIVIAGLLVITLTVALRCRGVFDATRRGAARRLARLPRYVPWELITAALAFLSWRRMVPRPTSPPQGHVLIEADPAGLAFPLLVVLTAALVAARLARLGLALAHRARWRWTAGHLALRRLAAARGAAVGVLVVGILAVGTLTVGSGIAGAQQDGLNSKAGMLVGANSTVRVSADTGVDPARLPANTTIVGISDEPGRTLLVIDPATFTQQAALDVQAADQLRGTLKALQEGDSRRALRVNRSLAGPQVPITFQDNVATVAYTASFPYIGTRPGYVVPRTAVKDLREIGRWEVWSSRPAAQLSQELDAAGIAHYSARTADTALDGLPFLTVTWTFTFVAALGLVLAVVAAVALVLAVEVRRRQNALSGALAVRMGLSRRTLVASHGLELGVLAVLATTTGLATGLITTGVSLPLFDPAPWLRPITSIPHMLPTVLTIYAVTACVVGLVCWTAVRSVRGARIGELIRVTT